MAYVLGITGGIATGKSTVAKYLESLGACRISADEIARELLAPGSPTTLAVIEEFGDSVRQPEHSGATPAINRNALARIIFSDESARHRLNAIMHPPIDRALEDQIAAAKANPACALVAVEIPLLYESHLEYMVDGVLVAACPEPTQIYRLLERNPSLFKSDAQRQMRSQMPLTEKINRATLVVDTDRPMIVVETLLRDIYSRLANIPNP